MNIEKEVKDVLDKIRQYLQRDGGDVEFVSIDDEGCVYVRVFGACVGCSAIDVTIKMGVETLLIEEVLGVTEVIVID